MRPDECAFYKDGRPDCPMSLWYPTSGLTRRELARISPYCAACRRLFPKERVILSIGNVCISSTQPIPQAMIQTLARCIRKNTEKARTGHWM